MKKLAVWMLVAHFSFLGCFYAQESNPQERLDTASILKELARYYPIKPKLPKEYKDYLSAKSKKDVSREIIAELRKQKVYDEWTEGGGLDLASAACLLFSSLDLPEADIIAELDKEGTPCEKVEFIELLRGRTDPAAIEALLNQLKDKRIFDEGFAEHRHYHKRVCDRAIDIISLNLKGSYSSIGITDPDAEREKVIAETLQKLNLKVPVGDQMK
jgi:hypothetical protein